MREGRIELHVITKNFQTIRSELRFHDFCIELSQCDYDMFFFLFRLRPYIDLKQLRLQTAYGTGPTYQKKLSREIVKLQRREVRKWKSSNPQRDLSQPNKRKVLQRLQHGIWRQIADQPPPNDFADMLENIFSGHPSNPSPPPLNLQKPIVIYRR